MEEKKKKPIEKKILHQGNKNSPDFVHGTKIVFHFATKWNDETIDDSRTWDEHGPMEIICGKKFKFECWELCLQTMAEGEISSFKISKTLTCNYPSVAKILRDSFDPRRNKKIGPNKQQQHMCGMMAMQMQGGLGYDDLNELMKSPSDLEFVFEVVKIIPPEGYRKENWQMDPEEKLGRVPQLKEEGNNLFREKQIEKAAEKYSNALVLLEQLMLREKPNDTEWCELREQKKPLLLNLAQCKLSSNEFYPVIEYCTEVLEADQDNVKALFRRAKAHSGVWNPSEAKADFIRVSELDPSLSATCKKEIRKIETLEKEKDKEDKEKLRKLFDENK